jgi:hypothetical protein
VSLCGVEWGFLQWFGAMFGAVLFLYMAARVVSAAVFKSKQDHESMRGKVQTR